MNYSKAVYARKGIAKTWWILIAALALLAPAHGQGFDVTPLVGVRLGGSVDAQPEGQPKQVHARLADSVTFGVAAGIRFHDTQGCEDCSVIQFRWMRQNTNLGLVATTTPVPTPPVATPLTTAFGRTSVALDHYLADFAYEWNLEDAPTVRPFILASLGAAYLSTPVSGNARFTFGLGAGVKIFPRPHWGVRLQVEYLPMVMHSGIQQVVCGASCVVTLGGGLLNQFEFTAGPEFRF
jgi:hypothetical protein